MVSTSPTNGQEQSMLTSKNLTILEDQLNFEALASKKLDLYAKQCQDANLKNICEKASQMNKRHFDALFAYLNDHNKPQQ